MIFEISSGGPSGQRRTFCGVSEFTAVEGTALLPTWMIRNLEIKDGDTVQIRRVQLPKGTFLRLQPHTAGMSQSSAAMPY